MIMHREYRYREKKSVKDVECAHFLQRKRRHQKNDFFALEESKKKDAKPHQSHRE